MGIVIQVLPLLETNSKCKSTCNPTVLLFKSAACPRKYNSAHCSGFAWSNSHIIAFEQMPHIRAIASSNALTIVEREAFQSNSRSILCLNFLCIFSYKWHKQ